MSSTHIIVLAAGKGTRMKSALPKVLHPLAGRALCTHVLKCAEKLNPTSLIYVVSQDGEAVENELNQNKSKKTKLSFAVQKEQKGTGHAFRVALEKVKDKSGQILLLYGDMPLVQSDTLKKLVAKHKKSKAALSLITFAKENPFGFGRILRDAKGNVVDIVEEKDASDSQKKICEVNVGLYVFDVGFAKKFAQKLSANNKQKEYYLTDMIRLAVKAGLKVADVSLTEASEALGVNSQKDLNHAGTIYQNQRLDELMESGVVIRGRHVELDATIKIEAGATLHSPCWLYGETVVASGAVIEPGCTIKDSFVGKDSHVKSGSYLDEAKLGEACHVGPMAHLRPGSVLMKKAKVGNFVELKKTTVGEGSKVNHLSYVGDATLGKKVNVGAGTITCNYDGFNKFKTILDDGVFIGSDSQLVAPVHIKKGAFVGAGSTITRDVSADSLVISRVRQREIKGWAKKHRQKND